MAVALLQTAPQAPPRPSQPGLPITASAKPSPTSHPAVPTWPRVWCPTLVRGLVGVGLCSPSSPSQNGAADMHHTLHGYQRKMNDILITVFISENTMIRFFDENKCNKG